MILIILAIISIVILFWQISNFVSVIFGSLYVKTNKELIRQALTLSGLKKGEVFCDLGCGNGDVLIEAAKLGAKVYGYEISPYYYLLSRFRTFKYRNIKVKYQNLKKADFEKADVVYCYLLPKLLDELSPKFKNDLKPSKRLVSIGFPVKSLKRFKRYTINNHQLYIYY